MSDGKGGFFYVYCAQHGKRTTNGAGYDIVNVDESGYLYRENANHIQYIVENGWWDTDTGVGSLANVKKLVSEDKRDQIDPKQDVFTKGGADKKLDFHGLRKELDHYVFSGQNQHRITGLSPVRFCN